MTKLTVIIVLFNEFDMVKRCLQSIYQAEIPHMEVILVDNSTDKTGYKQVLTMYPKIQYMQNTDNLGFGKAVNIGLQHAKGKFALILTPDTKVFRGTIHKTVSYIDAHKDVAFVGCKIYSHPKKFHPSAFHTFPNIFSHIFEYNQPVFKVCQQLKKEYHPLFYGNADHRHMLSAKHIIGGYMLLRMSAIKNIGYFDNRFRMYREETDLCKRLYDLHWKIVYLPVDGLMHYGGAKWKTASVSQALPGYMESTYIFFKKHYGIYYALFAWLLGSFSALLSLPYFGGVILIKKILHKKSQSESLFPQWITILSWHITQGLPVIFQK